MAPSMEKGIKPDEDYGTQFLDARRAKADDQTPPPPPPPPPPAPEATGGGRGRWIVAAIAALVLIVGLVALLARGGGTKTGTDQNLLTAGPGVSVDPNNPRLRITTTTERRGTTTTRATTTTTTPPTTAPAAPVTSVPGQPAQTVPGAPPQTATSPGTVGPQCPAGSVSTNLAPSITSASGIGTHSYHVQVNGETVNNTKGRIAVVVTVPVVYYVNNTRSTVNLTVPGGLVAPAFSSEKWTVSTDVTAQSQPSVGQPEPGYYFVDPPYANCKI